MLENAPAFIPTPLTKASKMKSEIVTLPNDQKVAGAAP
jgi:hypothetical protein